jgi:hypothetical protein
MSREPVTDGRRRDTTLGCDIVLIPALLEVLLSQPRFVAISIRSLDVETLQPSIDGTRRHATLLGDRRRRPAPFDVLLVQVLAISIRPIRLRIAVG